MIFIFFRRTNRLFVGVVWRRFRRDWGVRGFRFMVILGFVIVGGGVVEIRRVSVLVSFVIVNEILIFFLYNILIK